MRRLAVALGLSGCMALTGCTAVRIATGDFGWCRDKLCEDLPARVTETYDCVEAEPESRGGWELVREPPSEQAWWFGTCSWIPCQAHWSGLCKGAYRVYEGGRREIVLPTTDDRAFEHEVVHHVFSVEDRWNSHLNPTMLRCGLPRFTCPD